MLHLYLSPFPPPPSQITSPDDLPAVVTWVRFALSWPPAYKAMLQWKHDAPAASFLALLDLTLTPATCRLCIHVADRVSERGRGRGGWSGPRGGWCSRC